MSAVFVIDKQYLLHKEGTKFYQVLRVIVQGEVSRRSITAKNWGPQKGTNDLAPLQSRGQMSWESGDKYTSWIKAKKARGYQEQIKWGSTEKVNGIEALEVRLVVEFGRVEATKVLDSLGFGSGDAVDPSTDAEYSPAFDAARSARAPRVHVESESLEDWGEF